MEKLNAVTLKEQLWETLNRVKDGTMDPAQADSVAAQAREILRTAKTQIAIIDRAKMLVPEELKDFASKE